MRKKLLLRVKQFLKHVAMSVLPPWLTIRLFVLHQWFLGEPELHLLSLFVKSEQTSVDVGANLGLYSFLLARCTQKVTAYEPNPEINTFLRSAMPRNVVIREVGVSAESGCATLSVPEIDGMEMDSFGSIEPGVVKGSRDFQVEIVCLDEEGLENVGFIKIDVEGHEESVLKGAEKLIIRDRPTLLVEIEQRHHRGQDISCIFQYILELGYIGWFLKEGEMLPLEDFSVKRDQTAHLSDVSSPLYINNFIFNPVR